MVALPLAFAVTANVAPLVSIMRCPRSCPVLPGDDVPLPDRRDEVEVVSRARSRLGLGMPTRTLTAQELTNDRLRGDVQRARVSTEPADRDVIGAGRRRVVRAVGGRAAGTAATGPSDGGVREVAGAEGDGPSERA